MATVALLVHPTRADAASVARKAIQWLETHGHRARLLRLSEVDRVLEDGETRDLAEVDLAGVDVAFSFGGDGTFLRLVPLAFAADVPVLGVNFGRLGYLLEAEPERLEQALERTLEGKVEVETRVVLGITVEGEAKFLSNGDRSLPATGGDTGSRTTGRWWLALNEMVVQKTVPGHMVRLSTTIDGRGCLTHEADGVLLATPTGSTAYNLSAGGPVVSPNMAAMILTPIAPHLSVARSLVLEPEKVVSVGVADPLPAVLVVDGREVAQLAPGATVECRVARRRLRVVSLQTRGLAGLFRSALEPGRRP